MFAINEPKNIRQVIDFIDQSIIDLESDNLTTEERTKIARKAISYFERLDDWMFKPEAKVTDSYLNTLYCQWYEMIPSLEFSPSTIYLSVLNEIRQFLISKI